MTKGEQERKVSPSEFMRQLRPELYSDTSDRATYLLDAMTLEYCLDTVTAQPDSRFRDILPQAV